jgi:hypothetical protein
MCARDGLEMELGRCWSCGLVLKVGLELDCDGIGLEAEFVGDVGLVLEMRVCWS